MIQAEFANNGPSGNARVIAINSNFFNTKAFENRSTDDATEWKPIFQEACGLNLGTFRSMTPNGDSTFDIVKSGGFANVETSGEGRFGTGTADKPFGTLAFKGVYSAAHGTRLETSMDSLIEDNWPAMAGVWIKYNGTTYGSKASHIPAFVLANWDKTVGRTAIGISSTSKAVRIVVIQPGAAEAKTGGVSVPTLQKMFSSTFDSVLLLDGGGSSSLAASFPASTITGATTTTGRPGSDCLFSLVKTCTKRGNYVSSWAVRHWRGEDGTDDTYMVPGPDDNTKVVDRWIPNAFILVDEY